MSLSKLTHHMWRNHPLIQRNKVRKRALGRGELLVCVSGGGGGWEGVLIEITTDALLLHKKLESDSFCWFFSFSKFSTKYIVTSFSFSYVISFLFATFEDGFGAIFIKSIFWSTCVLFADLYPFQRCRYNFYHS